MSLKPPREEKVHMDEKSRNYWVIKGNEITRQGRYGYTLQQIKILDFCISKIRPYDPGDGIYTMTVTEYCKVAGINIDSGNNHAAVRRGLQALSDKSFWLPIGKKLVLTRWLQKVAIETESEIIEFQFDPDILPYVANLGSGYTQMELPILMSFNSKHGHRLYEFLKSFYYKVIQNFEPIQVEITLDKFREMMLIDGYTVFNDLRKRVIEVAVKEINEYSDMKLTYTTYPAGAGKKVEKLIFTVSEPAYLELNRRMKARRK